MSISLFKIMSEFRIFYDVGFVSVPMEIRLRFIERGIQIKMVAVKKNLCDIPISLNKSRWQKYLNFLNDMMVQAFDFEIWV